MKMKNRSELFKTNLIYFILLCAFVVVRILFALNVFKLPEFWDNYISSALIQIVLMFGLTFCLYMLLFKKKSKEVFKDFNYNKINYKAVLISIAIGVCVYVLNIGISLIFNYLLLILGYSSGGSSATSGVVTWAGFLSSILLTAVLPAFGEEFAHRGLLFKGFSSLGAKKTIILSGLLFGLMHLNVSQFFYATIIGMFLAILVMSSGSIVPAIIVHFMNNFINVYFSYADGLNLPLRNVRNVFFSLITEHGFLSVVILFSIMIGFGFLLVFLTKELFRQTYAKKFEKIKNEIAMEYLRDEIMGQIESPKVSTGESGLVFDEEVDIQGNRRLIKIKIPFERMGVEVKPQFKPRLVDNIFFYASIVLGAVITLFTFIWGVVG